LVQFRQRAFPNRQSKWLCIRSSLSAFMLREARSTEKTVKLLNMTLALGGAVALFAVAPLANPARAQDTTMPSTASHQNWTLNQREDWLHHKIEASRDSGTISRVEFDRVKDALHGIKAHEDAMRDGQKGQLTPAQTEDLEAQLDQVAEHIRWANDTALALPW
jgi:hypothetical protein